jgi:hypothetical protein
MKKYDRKTNDLKMVNQLMGMHGSRPLSKNSNLYKKIMGIKPKKRRTKNAPTEAQLSGRQKFTVAFKAVSLCKPLTDASYEWESENEKPKVYGRLFKQVYHKFIRGSYPNFTVFYPQLRLSPGRIIDISQLNYSVSATGEINISWKDASSSMYNFNEESVIHAFVINVTKQKSRLYRAFPYPTDCKLRIARTDYSEGDELHCWVLLKWYWNKNVSDCGYATEVKSVDPLNP